MSKLSDTIKKLYNNEISEQEAVEAENNLIGFFKILMQVDARLKQEEKQIGDKD